LINTTGSFQALAMLSDSCVVPWLDAPSPKKQAQTPLVSLYWQLKAAPTAKGPPPPTMPLAPRMPILKSAMCMEPPLPLQ